MRNHIVASGAVPLQSADGWGGGRDAKKTWPSPRWSRACSEDDWSIGGSSQPLGSCISQTSITQWNQPLKPCHPARHQSGSRCATLAAERLASFVPGLGPGCFGECCTGLLLPNGSVLSPKMDDALSRIRHPSFSSMQVGEVLHSAEATSVLITCHAVFDGPHLTRRVRPVAVRLHLPPRSVAQTCPS
nr:hypothetical protein CFP56_04273 [Quercus suber]